MRRHAAFRITLAASIAAATALATTSCTAPPGRSGAAAATITLRSVYGNGAASVGADALRALLEDDASPVTLSDMTDDVVSATTTDSDGDTIKALRSGRADVAVVRSGRLVQAGAKTLLALQAPMVVTNDEQARKIAKDPAVLRSLDGLQDIGLVGIALVPGGVRHPFGYEEAVQSPKDFDGKVFNIRHDANVQSMITALGATADYSVGTERSAAVRAGTLRGIEASMGQSGAADRPAVVTSNLALYEKFDVVVMRAKVFDTLSEAQQTALRTRATADAAHAVAIRRTEEQGLADWCALPGGESIVVPASAIDAFHRALDPVVTRIADDSESSALIERMRALHAGTADPAGTTCSGAAAPTGDPFTLKPKGDQTVLDGIWRAEVSADDLRTAGANEQDALNNEGVWTYRIKNGIANVDQPHGAQCTMRFTIAGDEVLLDEMANGNDACYGLVRGRFTREADAITFTWTAQRDYDVALDRVIFRTFTKASG